MERSSTEIFSLPQAIENSRQFLLLRTERRGLRVVAFTQHLCLAVALSAEVIKVKTSEFSNNSLL